MHQFTGTAFGIGMPATLPVSQNPWSVSPFAAQGYGGSYGIGPFSGTVPSLQQLTQLLQIVPQQLQQLQVLQQQQLVQLQQLLQLLPAQLQQLQQLIQVVPHQIQQLQQQWQPLTSGVAGPFGFGLVPQAFPTQASHVM
jgi:hypothetical protein